MKTYEIIGWLDDRYGKWSIEAENEDGAIETLKGMFPEQELVVMAIMTTM